MADTNDFLGALGSFQAPNSSMDNSNPAVEELMKAQQSQRAQIDAYTKEFRPLTASDFGTQALEALMADGTKDKIQRAAAFEAINPGVQAGVGVNGEITLTAAPGSDLGFKYPVFSQQTSKQQGQLAGQRVSDTLGNFESQFNKIQAMTDPAEIASAYSTLQGATAALVEDKRAQLRGQFGNSEGLTQLEQTIQQDKVLDEQFWQSQGLPYSGPTDESMANLAAYDRVKRIVDGQVNEALQGDSQLATIDAQMKSLGMLVDAKLRKSFSGEGAETAAAMQLVGPEAIDAVFQARGIDPTAASATDRQIVAAQLFSGQANATRQSMEIGMAPSEQVATLAATQSGDIGAQAKRVLDLRTGSADISKQIMAAYQAFDTNVLPTLSKEQQDSLKVPLTITNAKEKAAAQEEIKLSKMSMVIENLKAQREQGFANNAQSWDLPQSPLLSEVELITKDILSKDPKATISIDQIAQRMDWSGSDLQSKITALSDYINSQAARLPDNQFFGQPMLYSNPDMSKRYVQSLAVKARVGFGYNANSGTLVQTMGSDPYGRDQSFRQRMLDNAKRDAGVQ